MTLEFTLENSEGERTGEDEMSWCARELGQVVSLPHAHLPPAPAPARPQTCFSRLRFVHPARVHTMG